MTLLAVPFRIGHRNCDALGAPYRIGRESWRGALGTARRNHREEPISTRYHGRPTPLRRSQRPFTRGPRPPPPDPVFSRSPWPSGRLNSKPDPSPGHQGLAARADSMGWQQGLPARANSKGWQQGRTARADSKGVQQGRTATICPCCRRLEETVTAGFREARELP